MVTSDVEKKEELKSSSTIINSQIRPEIKLVESEVTMSEEELAAFKADLLKYGVADTGDIESDKRILSTMKLKEKVEELGLGNLRGGHGSWYPVVWNTNYSESTEEGKPNYVVVEVDGKTYLQETKMSYEQYKLEVNGPEFSTYHDESEGITGEYYKKLFKNLFGEPLTLSKYDLFGTGILDEDLLLDELLKDDSKEE